MTARGQSGSMDSYEVKDAFSLEDDLFGGRFRVEFKPGKHTPKNEQEEHALEWAVAHGHATRPKPAKEK